MGIKNLVIIYIFFPDMLFPCIMTWYSGTSGSEK